MVLRGWRRIGLALLLCGMAHAVNGSGDTPAGRLDTRAPDLSATEVEPAETLGRDLFVRVHADEALAYPPRVEINARPSELLPSTTYEFKFLVLPGDHFRPGDLYIEGVDLVGNIASLHRTITVLAPLPVPLRPYLLALVLLAAGVGAVRWRGHRVPPVVLCLALAASAAAEHPAVTNASFQHRATASGTEIVITYDLSAPNGPCDITVHLSKDGGLDGYPFAATSVSGDLNGVVDGPGHSITWNVSADYPNEDLPSASLRITADDGQPEFTVQYLAGTGGSISGDATQAIVLHHDSAAVTAIGNLNYRFTSWSDGVLTATRNDLDITGDLSVTANFTANLVEMVAVPAGSFDMGRTSTGDDATYGASNELPVHTVQLSAYQIGKYEVTNEQFCAVMNWAHARQLLRSGAGVVWTQTSGGIYAGSPLKLIFQILDLTTLKSPINFVSGQFVPRNRNGLPTGTVYSLATHPVVMIHWEAAAMFTNWLSEMEGLTPVYDSAFSATLTNNGYRLPTEAQWERAAAWDGSKHWIYGFTSDSLGGAERANQNRPATVPAINPLGLTIDPATSPVGWFNGVNVSPKSNVTTVNSQSPVGCYDITGNAAEYCHDYYAASYYTSSPAADPTGPATGTSHVTRGGYWRSSTYADLRTARRLTNPSPQYVGFRIAR